LQPGSSHGTSGRRGSVGGFSLIELLIVIAVILIIAAIAIPSLMRSRMAANEGSAVSTLRTLHTVLVSYANTYPSTTGAVAGQCGFPDSLVRLGPGSPPTSAAADLLDVVLAAAKPVKAGYGFTYVPASPDAIGCNAAYAITATPQVAGVTGQRGLFIDQSGVIRFTPAVPPAPTAASPPL
jgi:prepilin-type N-terminal cleavage/methylation domain-containing protein